ncbi:amidohydrolase family protein [Chryseobacterium rhizosphaerae]|uniref:Amidohydrolase n=1 Tax=Chryseobacterium rhizosphaerae TaxID=395937 RepID=A0ABX9ILW1_9FLAO|nr:amidohydrolase family protein [Chryseobacterium rhizosphaerae]REC75638.1 amidohydrolase [Chryseobacterium rhizosphaerae]GEN68873.1 amidohydrolase [Chryseobacterium rhizosphaerae]
MKKFQIALAIILCFNGIRAQVYIQNVTIADVIHKKMIPAQTIIINNGKITKIKPSKQIKIPQNSHVINGEGKYLIPGMTDSHIHFFQSGGLYTRPDALDLRKHVPYEKEISWGHHNMENLLQYYLKAGITSVIDPGATYHFLLLRDSLKRNERLPSVYMSGPLITTYEPEVFKNLNKDEPFKLALTAEDARKWVQEQLPYKPDFIKIWYIVLGDAKKKKEEAQKLEPVIKATIEEAHKNNLKVAVHATERFTAETAVMNGANYLVHNIEDEVVSDDFVKLLQSKKVILCPTLTVMDNYYDTYAQKKHYNTYELEHSNPKSIGSMYDLKHLEDTSDSAMIKKYKLRFNSPQIKAYTSKTDSIRRINLKKLTDGGVTIAAGTDAGNIGTQHGTSFITELKAMKESGMNGWQLLQSATINPAKILNKEAQYGSIEEGKVADLVLLNANPIENLENLTQIDTVIKNGQPLNPNTILETTNETLVQQQVNGYNARNIDAFLEPYAEDVELYSFPSKLLSKGKEAMKKSYEKFFADHPDLHCEVRQRITNLNTIIDRESISGVKPDKKIEATAIYEIKNNKIAKVYFLY